MPEPEFQPCPCSYESDDYCNACLSGKTEDERAMLWGEQIVVTARAEGDDE